MLSPLLLKWSAVSIDAEGRPRDADDHFNAEAAIINFYQASQQERTTVALSCLAGNR